MAVRIVAREIPCVVVVVTNMDFPNVVYYDINKRKTILVYANHKEEMDLKPIVFFNELITGFGSSYQGRVDAFKKITNAKQKGAVLISELEPHLYFPLFSEKKEDCIWLNFKTLYQVHRKNENNCIVSFFDGCKMDIAVNIRIIKNQMKRCRQFMEYLQNYPVLLEDWHSRYIGRN